MKLFSFGHMEEGHEIDRAIISCWYTMVDYGDGPKFRTCGIALLIPAPYFGEYATFFSPAVYRGWRFPRLILRCGFALAEFTKPRIYAKFTSLEFGNKELIATREECEDGLKVSKFFKRCDHKGEE